MIMRKNVEKHFTLYTVNLMTFFYKDLEKFASTDVWYCHWYYHNSSNSVTD